MGERRQERQTQLYDYITRRPHEPMTLAAVAFALGRSPGKAFSMDIAVVRHWANDAGACITNCYWNDTEQAYTFVYLPVKQEAKLSVRPLRTQSRQARTRLTNLGKQAAYTARNAVEREDRAYGRLNFKVSQAVEDIFAAVEDFEHEHNGQPS